MIPLFVRVKQYPGGCIETHMPAQLREKVRLIDWDPTESRLPLEIASCSLSFCQALMFRRAVTDNQFR